MPCSARELQQLILSSARNSSNKLHSRQTICLQVSKIEQVQAGKQRCARTASLLQASTTLPASKATAAAQDSPLPLSLGLSHACIQSHRFYTLTPPRCLSTASSYLTR